jgi:hypothetical protein
MTFRALNTLPDKAFTEAKSLAASIRSQAQQAATDFTSTGADADRILSLIRRLIGARKRFNELKTTPGLAAHAQEQENDPTYDVAAEFTAMLATLQAAEDALIAAIPRDGSGYLLLQTMNAQGDLGPRQFTPAQLNSIVPLFVAIVDSIS